MGVGVDRGAGPVGLPVGARARRAAGRGPRERAVAGAAGRRPRAPGVSGAARALEGPRARFPEVWEQEVAEVESAAREVPCGPRAGAVAASRCRRAAAGRTGAAR
ncbi:hypothetical protein JOE68_000020 [Saccharothrix algeriensis]|uniref:Uncharacterized protein n=1 Tax=Saccharothrix algeriensis TaxID=173560 RepID=A0ABS2RZV3_9PSEU|nr:hypothetical protein [Saccharothrix algeriensis]